jgi:low temperature requirement protein LtrA
VLGESIVAVAAGVADVGWRLDSTLIAVAGFTIAACIWWTYFDYVEARALRVGKRDSILWGYGHLFIYAAIATVGVGTQLAIEGGVEAAVASVVPIIAAPSGFGVGARGILCGGVAIYLLAISAIHSVNRHTFRDGTLALRLVAVTGATLIGVMGDSLGPLAVTALLALALGCVTAFEISRSDPSPELPAT